MATVQPTWQFSDGTILELGGLVTGTSEFADSLRFGIEGAARGLPLTVFLWTPPEGGVQFDANNVAILDAYARDVARTRGVTVASGPEFEAPPDPNGPIPEPDSGSILVR